MPWKPAAIHVLMKYFMHSESNARSGNTCTAKLRSIKHFCLRGHILLL